MSSLATQLAQNTSLNSSLLTDRSKRRSTESYLFASKEANRHDLESIHALALNGLLQLASLNPALGSYEDKLLGDHIKNLDRTLLSVEANENLDTIISGFLPLLGPYLTDTATGKVIEWLVRRLRIHEFNVDVVLSLFLPYHESLHFAKMLTILHIECSPQWRFLLPVKKAAQSIPRIMLVNEMASNSDVARFITSLLPNALSLGVVHRTLITFNAAVLHGFVSRSKNLDESTVAYLLPAILKPLTCDGVQTKSIVLGAYVLLAGLSQKCKLQIKALHVVINAMTSHAQTVSVYQYLTALVAVCQSQTLLDSFSDTTMEAMLQISEFRDGLREAMTWVDSDKILYPLVSGLGSRLQNTQAFNVLEFMLTAQSMPSLVAKYATLLLLRQSISVDEGGNKLDLSSLLSLLQLRHPDIFESAAKEVSEQDELSKSRVAQLVIATSLPTDTNEQVNYIIGSRSADIGIRVASTTSLLSSLSRGADSNSDQSYCALLERTGDSSSEVIEALYQQPTIIAKLLVSHSKTYVRHLRHALCLPSVKPKRALVRAHFEFLTKYFFEHATSDTVASTFYQILLPFMLFSKPRQHTAEVVWAIIANSTVSGHDAFSLLSGCVELISSDQDWSDPVARMGRLNIAITRKMAENMVQNDSFQSHMKSLLECIRDENPHLRNMAYLIAIWVLRLPSNQNQIESAREIFEASGLKQLDKRLDYEQASLSSFFFPSGSLCTQISDDTQLGRLIASKPSSPSTLHCIQTSLIALLAGILPPVGSSLNWFQIALENEHRGSLYVSLMKDVYRVANTLFHLPTRVLNTIFNAIDGDSLALLASVWADPPKYIDPEHLRAVALMHGIAYLKAHLDQDIRIDFQTIIPSLLVALQSPAPNCRELALEVISILRQLANSSFTSVYKFDTIYGDASRELEYIEQADVMKYLDALIENRDHLSHDSEYLVLTNQLHLKSSRQDKKKDAEYKRRILCYLISHANCVAVPDVQLSIFTSVRTLSDKTKITTMLPIINQTLFSPASGPVDPSVEALQSLILSSFDASIAQDLNEQSSASWPVFLKILGHLLMPSAPSSARSILLRSLQENLFGALQVDRQLELCRTVLDVGCEHIDAQLYCKPFLSTILSDVALLVQLLKISEPQTSSGPREAKRAKINGPDGSTVPHLILLIECIHPDALPESLDLVIALLNTLDRVTETVVSSEPEVNYLQQVLMSIIESMAVKVKEVPNSVPSVIRLDVLVEIIRVSNNTQTFHQALLLMATLARLAPDSVLHNVMPIFTFMGSNVFHRDDAYSFSVVQKTIENIVPIVVSSLKRQHQEGVQLYKVSREFLTVFTDAANHVPRHRRTKFYTHLIHVLGPRDFLPPVLMLLVEKLANRAVRQGADELQTTLALPTAILQYYPPEVQIQTMAEIIRECRAISTRQPGTSCSFIEERTEHASSGSLHMKKVARALLLLVKHALQTSLTTSHSVQGSPALPELAAVILSLTTQPASDRDLDEFTQLGFTALNSALNVMTAMDFVRAAVSMLRSTDEKIQTRTLELLNDRLVYISEEARSRMAPSMTSIIECIITILASPLNDARTRAAFATLKTLSLTVGPGEEAALSHTINPLLGCIKNPHVADLALSTLAPISVKLGPRIIPFFREIVSSAAATLRSSDEIPHLTHIHASDVLHSLLSSIPQFWGVPEFRDIFNLYLDQTMSTTGASSRIPDSLVKTLTRKVKANVLLPVVINIWPSARNVVELRRIKNYFGILRRVLHAAPGAVITENLRPLFNIFVEGFDLVLVEPDEQNHPIKAFKYLVTKLNETTFKPLFRRLYDWAFIHETATKPRRLTFLRIYLDLLNFFKGLMTPYLSFFMGSMLDLLQSKDLLENTEDEKLWHTIVEVLSQSLTFDDTDFWKDNKLHELSVCLIQQLPLVANTNALSPTKDYLQNAFVALVESCTDDALLKKINLDILLHSRAEKVQTRLYALKCSFALWQAHGRKLIGFATETATFIAECSEDDNEVVVKKSLLLKIAVENVAGPIETL
ncbi:hypothetical protein AX16_003419 [Volvariella volvacea WC 439]|nr:hypothetical protein AX16_003419 [Volvariella volvacea WC 439]